MLAQHKCQGGGGGGAVREAFLEEAAEESLGVGRGSSNFGVVTWSLPSWVALGKFLKPCKPQVPPCKMRVMASSLQGC
jgi:hypothetical protein